MEMAARVAVVSCGSYDNKEIEGAVAKALDLLGGIGESVREHPKVLLKVNLTKRAKPEEAATTNPAVVKAIAKEILKYGGVPIVGDSQALKQKN